MGLPAPSPPGLPVPGHADPRERGASPLPPGDAPPACREPAGTAPGGGAPAASYRLGVPGLDTHLPGVAPGTNLLVIGPPMSGKGVLVRNAIHAGLSGGEAAVLVAMNGLGGESLWEWFRANSMDLEAARGRVGVVDCVSQTIGLAVGDTESIKRVSSPVNLTGLSVAVMGFLEEFTLKRRIRRLRLCVDGLSTMLMYSNLQTVFRFLHVFTGRIKMAGALGLYVVEEGVHDAQTLNALAQLADGVVEVKRGGDRLFMRVSAVEQATPWVRFRIDGGRVVPEHSPGDLARGTGRIPNAFALADE